MSKINDRAKRKANYERVARETKYCRINAEFRCKTKSTERKHGPRIVFRDFFNSYIEENFENLEDLSPNQIKDAILLFFEENENCKRIYSLDDILVWAKEIIETKKLPKEQVKTERFKREIESDGR